MILKKQHYGSCHERNVCDTFPLLTPLRSLGVAGKPSRRSNAVPISSTKKRVNKKTTGERIKKENPPERLFDRRLFPGTPSSGSLGTSSRIFGALAKSNGTTSSGSAFVFPVGVDGVSLNSAFLVRLRFFWRCPTTTIVSSTTSALTVCLREAGTNGISSIAPSAAVSVVEVSTTSAEETTVAGGGA